MSFDVEKTLVEIIATQKHIDESQAVAYIENMREAGRLLKDVY
jgi:sulfite reductase alpha subunit-like flavoprotein